MRTRVLAFLMFALLSLGFVSQSQAESTQQQQGIHWHSWSKDLFEQAKSEHKLIFIYGRVSWCHWCHNMETLSYQDPAVIQAMRAHYIPIEVDLEQEPSTAGRYQIDAMPTMIILNPENQELKRFSGYTSAWRLSSILNEVAKEAGV